MRGFLAWLNRAITARRNKAMPRRATPPVMPPRPAPPPFPVAPPTLPPEPVPDWRGPPGPGSRVFDVYIVAPEHTQAAQAQYGNGMAWAYLGTNESVWLEQYWPAHIAPRRTTPDKCHLQTGEMCKHLVTPLQQGFYIHEILGHACLKLGHDSPHVSMHKAEDRPQAERFTLVLEVAQHYSYLRVMQWVPGSDVHADDPLPLQPEGLEAWADFRERFQAGTRVKWVNPHTPNGRGSGLGTVKRRQTKVFGYYGPWSSVWVIWDNPPAWMGKREECVMAEWLEVLEAQHG